MDAKKAQSGRAAEEAGDEEDQLLLDF